MSSADEQEPTLLTRSCGVSKQEATVRAVDAAARDVRPGEVAALSAAARERYADLLERVGR